ncbi:MAG: hypothetical protein FWB96_11960 [Defluviitaleaceae bacterium]|nr:hypothetical protein [Defluviitaleaceae bacterium]MCL2263797.1 hypothetical protein [Defluviitaleaceae bacterium]
MSMVKSEDVRILVNTETKEKAIIADSKYSNIEPSREDEYQTFESWKEAKEWLSA